MRFEEADKEVQKGTIERDETHPRNTTERERDKITRGHKNVRTSEGRGGGGAAAAAAAAGTAAAAAANAAAAATADGLRSAGLSAVVSIVCGDDEAVRNRTVSKKGQQNKRKE